MAAVLAHAFCNWMGFPRVWGRVGGVEVGGGPVVGMGPAGEARGKEDTEVNAERQGGNSGAGLGYTVAYYALLVAGAYGFYKNLWRLTESGNALVAFEKRKQW